MGNHGAVISIVRSRSSDISYKFLDIRSGDESRMDSFPQLLDYIRALSYETKVYFRSNPPLFEFLSPSQKAEIEKIYSSGIEPENKSQERDYTNITDEINSHFTDSHLFDKRNPVDYDSMCELLELFDNEPGPHDDYFTEEDEINSKFDDARLDDLESGII